MTTFVEALPRAYNRLDSRAKFKEQPADFKVHETLAFSFDGKPGHTYLLLEKTQQNTQVVIGFLARLLSVPSEDIGYAGLKDKQSISQQWFSLPGQISDMQLMAVTDLPGIEVLDCQQHSRKLRVGEVGANRFEITLRDFEGNAEAAAERLQLICNEGFPNYFGPQRFGHGDSNVRQLEQAWPLDSPMPTRHERVKKFLYSAARAYLFNLCLAKRLAESGLNIALAGDVIIEASSGRYTRVEEEREINEGQWLAGPLLGKQGFLTQSLALDLEQTACEPAQIWVQELQRSTQNSSPRPLLAKPTQLEWEFLQANTLRVSLELGKGIYATSLLRELLTFR